MVLIPAVKVGLSLLGKEFGKRAAFLHQCKLITAKAAFMKLKIYQLKYLTYHNAECNAQHEDVGTDIVAVIKENFWCMVSICPYNVVAYHFVRH